MDCVGGWRIVRAALGQFDVTGSEKRPDAVHPGLAVNIGGIIVSNAERNKWIIGAFRPPAEECVEHLLPGCGVDGGRLRQHTIQVEEACPDVFG